MHSQNQMSASKNKPMTTLRLKILYTVTYSSGKNYRLYALKVLDFLAEILCFFLCFNVMFFDGEPINQKLS